MECTEKFSGISNLQVNKYSIHYNYNTIITIIVTFKYTFRATVAQEYSTFWGGVESSLVEVVSPDTAIPSSTSEAATDPPVTTRVRTTSTTVAPVRHFVIIIFYLLG